MGKADGTDEEALRAMVLAPEGRFDAQSRGNTLHDLIRRSAARHPARMAIACGTTRWTYAEFDSLVSRLARGLEAEGVRPGDRIALLSRNSHWFAALRFAIARAGAVLVPVNFMLNAGDIAYILDHCRPVMLFTDASCREAGLEGAEVAGIATRFTIPGEDEGSRQLPGTRDFNLLLEAGEAMQAPPAIDPRSIAQIIYTSGTESRPKGAMLSHEAVLWEYQSCLIEGRWRADAVQLHALPLFHCAQLDVFLGPSLQIGNRNHIVAAASPEIIIPMIEEHRVTAFFAPPTVWIALLRSPLFERHDLSSLTQGYYGASIMPVAVLKELSERLPGLALFNFYGQTEIAPVATVLAPEDQLRKAGSAGRAAVHVETRVVDEAMNDVAPGEIGEVVHRSPQLLTGYWRDPERTAEAFAGGWFHSGDLATIDGEGYITIVDRKKDMINSGGENVSSREVEEAIFRHPAVSEVAVVGLPDDEWIEKVTAFVVVKQGGTLDEAELADHARGVLSSFKRPKRYVFVADLPRNASGKILKRELRAIASS